MSKPATVPMPIQLERELVVRRLLDRAIEAALSGDKDFNFDRWTQSAQSLLCEIDPQSRLFNVLANLRRFTGTGTASAEELRSLYGAQ